MLILRILAGLVSTALTCLIIIVFFDLTGFMINSFSLVFIVPVGGALAGASCAYGYYFLIKKFPVQRDINQLLVPVVLASIGFIGVYYGIYKESFVTNGEINYLFKGEHISNFSYEGSNELITFWSFLSETVTNSSSVISVRRIPVDGVDLGDTVYWIKFYVQLFGYVVGGLTVGLLLYLEAKSPKYNKTIDDRYNKFES